MRHLTWVVALSISALACTSTSAGPAPISAADAQAIRALDSGYVASWLADDTSGVMRTLAPDAVLMPAGHLPLATAAEIRGFWWPADGSRTRILTFSRVIDELSGEGNVAWTRGTDTLAFSYDKGATHVRQGSTSMTLAVVRRQPDGQWRISRMMWGTRAP